MHKSHTCKIAHCACIISDCETVNNFFSVNKGDC